MKFQSRMFAFSMAVVLVSLVSPDRAAADPAFTQAQAAAGRAAYREHCAVCHGARLEGLERSPSLVGARFDQMWRGNSADVLSFHLRRMPPETVVAAGTVSDETHTNILAYVLSSNGFKPGETALPTDMDALQSIEIPRPEGMEYNPDAPVKASPEQQERLAKLSPVTSEMLRDPSRNDWLQWGGTYKGQSYSLLDQINKENVDDLQPAWHAPLRPGVSMASPIVHDGIMFMHAFPDTVLALDATNGQVLWRHQYKSKTGSSSKLGVSLHGGRVLVPTSDLHVLALDAKTGELIWDHELRTEAPGGGRGGYHLRSTPLVAGGNVIQGVTSSFVPNGGFMVAIDIETGKESWRFLTIARPDQPGGNTWNGLPMEKRSGGSVWHQGTYDPELNLIYYGIAPTYDTGPLLKSINKPGITNDALYTNCTVAIDADSGRLVWHYQHMANDQWDLDWAFERQIATFDVDGSQRKVVMNVGKMAILDALDAATGEYLFSIDSGTQNVITHIDPVTGAKVYDPTKIPDPSRPCVVCPTASGGRAWPTTAYSPMTNFVYVPITEWCMRMGPEGMRLLTSGVGISGAVHPDAADGKMGRLQALDVANQKLAWTRDEVAPLSTSVLATAGRVVFTGTLEPSLKAYDDATGKTLWRATLDDMPSAGVITYSVDGTQYVAVTVGISNLHVGAMLGTFGEAVTNPDTFIRSKQRAGAAIWAFALP